MDREFDIRESLAYIRHWLYPVHRILRMIIVTVQDDHIRPYKVAYGSLVVLVLRSDVVVLDRFFKVFVV